MEPPLSPIITDVVMQDLEKNVLNLLNCKLLIYFRYVDDILLAAPSEQINNIFELFNNYYDRLKFTIEYENDKSLNLLHLRLKVMDNLHRLVSQRNFLEQIPFLLF